MAINNLFLLDAQFPDTLCERVKLRLQDHACLFIVVVLQSKAVKRFVFMIILLKLLAFAKIVAFTSHNLIITILSTTTTLKLLLSGTILSVLLSHVFPPVLLHLLQFQRIVVTVDELIAFTCTPYLQCLRGIVAHSHIRLLVTLLQGNQVIIILIKSARYQLPIH